MALIIKDFNSYTTKYSSIRVNTDNEAFASITCFNGNVDVGSISFRESRPLSENKIENNKIRMRLHISQFNDTIGILRSEKPLRMFFDEAKKEAYIGTGTLEPVGEQEGV